MLVRLAAFVLIALTALPGRAFDTTARQALVIDYETGAVLLEKNADAALPPASMSKLMTLNMLFEAVATGRFDLSDTFTVSETAWRMGGSTMFLEPRHRPTVEDLIRGIIIHSGNDACIVVAENLAGSEAAFARQMTARGAQIGLTSSTFLNSTGWPEAGHVMSARDLVTLATRLISEFPQYYPYFTEDTYTWDGITQPNRNPILASGLGGDGLKTGHTEEAGYGFVGSAQQNGRRIVFMLGGLSTAAARKVESERVLAWAFHEFENATLIEAGAEVVRAPVWIGAQDEVGLVTAGDVYATIPFGQKNNVTAIARFEGPLEAPIVSGAEVGELIVSIPDMPSQTVPLLAAEDVGAAGFFSRFSAAAGSLTGKALSSAFGDG